MSKQIRISDELVERIEKEGKLKMSDTYSTVILRLIAHEDEMREECKKKDKIIADLRLDQDSESQLKEKEEPEPEPETLESPEPEPLSEQEKRTKIMEFIRIGSNINRTFYRGIRTSSLIDISTKAKQIGIDIDELKEILDWLLKKNRIIEPSMGSYQVVY